MLISEFLIWLLNYFNPAYLHITNECVSVTIVCNVVGPAGVGALRSFKYVSSGGKWTTYTIRSTLDSSSQLSVYCLYSGSLNIRIIACAFSLFSLAPVLLVSSVAMCESLQAWWIRPMTLIPVSNMSLYQNGVQLVLCYGRVDGARFAAKTPHC